MPTIPGPHPRVQNLNKYPCVEYFDRPCSTNECPCFFSQPDRLHNGILVYKAVENLVLRNYTVRHASQYIAQMATYCHQRTAEITGYLFRRILQHISHRFGVEALRHSFEFRRHTQAGSQINGKTEYSTVWPCSYYDSNMKKTNAPDLAVTHAPATHLSHYELDTLHSRAKE